MYEVKSLDTEILLRWSKLVEYDFFRLYLHIIAWWQYINIQFISHISYW